MFEFLKPVECGVPVERMVSLLQPQIPMPPRTVPQYIGNDQPAGGGENSSDLHKQAMRFCEAQCHDQQHRTEVAVREGQRLALCEGDADTTPPGPRREALRLAINLGSRSLGVPIVA